MIVQDILAFCHAWSDTVWPVFAGIAGWFGNRLQAKLAAQRNAIAAQEAETHSIQMSLERERTLTDRIEALMHDAHESWRALYEREAVLVEYHTAAISARLNVHDLELRAGRSPTRFDPLPGYPPLQNTPRTLADAPDVAGDKAAPAANPGASNTHS